MCLMLWQAQPYHVDGGDADEDGDRDDGNDNDDDDDHGDGNHGIYISIYGGPG